MKIAVFDPYWQTLGGGERYTAAFVQTMLKVGHSVDVWWPENLSNKISERFGLDISLAHFTPPKSTLGYDVLFWLSDGSLPLSFARRTIIHFQYPIQDVSGRNWKNIFKSHFYTFVTNSHFTKKYVDREFAINSQVIYPPVDVSKFSPRSKTKMILYVGRFSNLTQSKGHAILAESFKKIHSKIPGWELVLTGGTQVGVDQKEMEDLKKMTKGYPIRLVLDPSMEELQDLYGRALIYCSPSGYGVSEVDNPMKAEHFGISVVEAMSAGCVPIVTNQGGHREIVQDQENGYLWTTTADLENLIVKVVNDPKLAKSLSQAAKTRSKIFSQEMFSKNFLQLV